MEEEKKDKKEKKIKRKQRGKDGLPVKRVGDGGSCHREGWLMDGLEEKDDEDVRNKRLIDIYSRIIN